MDSPVGFPLSGNHQTSENPPPLLHHSPSTNGIPLSENSQSSESPTNSPASCNGPPAIFTPEEMNAELSAMAFHNEISRYLREGRCRDYFNGWYVCMDRVIYHGENSQCCLWLAGILRDCMFENFDYYQPLLSHFRR
ncbi:hypothetical protein IEQ34_019884 [Dendrobium chrysotoxum]|uniref:GCK domain-containing protein n=1 Tax=Dendrobium chrysotoxum TaxID=161865 RepID=A0AAV7G9W2_DENCH|nr:hypothetical protein IEQ34_019884 [Dendrobium chrysotoxum]